MSATPDGTPNYPAKKVTNAFVRRGASVVVTRGNPVRYSEHAPDRLNWGPVAPEPFHQQVEE